jgi:hypothetical protein
MKLETTRLLAIYGAAVSSFAVLWNVYRDLNNRARIKLAAKIGYTVQDTFGQLLFISDSWLRNRDIRPDVMPILKITITNIGRRPATVTGWGAKLKRGEPTPLLEVVPYRLPMQLEEGNSTEQSTHDLTILNDRTKKIFARDSTGKYWYLKRKPMRSVRSEYKLYLEKRAQENS